MILKASSLLNKIEVSFSRDFVSNKNQVNIYIFTGPPAVPFLGSLPFVPHVPGLLATAATWFIHKYTHMKPVGGSIVFCSKIVVYFCRYGKVVGIYLGRFPAIAVYDFEVVKEIFADDDFSGRPDSFPYRFRSLGKRQGIKV